MQISDAIALSTYSLKQAIGTSVIQKAVNQDARSIQTIMEMAADTAKMTGVGGNIDLRI